MLRYFKIFSILFILIMCSGWKFVIAEKAGSKELAAGLNLKQEQKYSEAIVQLKAAVDKGDNKIKSRALVEIANFILKGRGVEKDSKKYFSLVKESAELGNEIAVLRLADAYRDGTGVTRDYKKALEVYQSITDVSSEANISILRMVKDNNVPVAFVPNEAELVKNAQNMYLAKARNGSREAMFALGRLYRYGDIFEKDIEKAEYWYRKAIDAGKVKAAAELADMWAEKGGSGDKSKALELKKQVAELGDRKTIKYLAQKYTEAKNPQEAFKWNLEAAKIGNADSMIYLVMAYEQGLGVDKNPDEAKKWTEEAVKKGKNSYTKIAKSYEQGNNKESHKKALLWYKRAAENGDSNAAYKLGKFYTIGFGTDVNLKEAFKWHKVAADKGQMRSILAIAKSYTVGLYAEQNHAKAIEWYNKAAEKGNAEAQYQLGTAYKHGFGVAIDDNKSKMWLERAKRNGANKI